MFTQEEFYAGKGDLFTTEEIRQIYDKILITPPFNNCMARFTAEINRIARERLA